MWRGLAAESQNAECIRASGQTVHVRALSDVGRTVASRRQWLLVRIVDFLRTRCLGVPAPVTEAAPEATDTAALLVGRAQAELDSEEWRGRDLLTKVAILTAVAGIELAAGIGVVSTQLHNHLPLQHRHVAVPVLGKAPLGTFLLVVLALLLVLVMLGAGGGLVGLIAPRYTAKRSGQARLQRLEAYVSQLNDSVVDVSHAQLAEIRLLIQGHVSANDRRERLFKVVVLPAVVAGVFAIGGLGAILGAGPVRPTDVHLVDPVATTTASPGGP